jgi:protein-arginine kinase activator protein McsA
MKANLFYKRISLIEKEGYELAAKIRDLIKNQNKEKKLDK